MSAMHMQPMECNLQDLILQAARCTASQTASQCSVQLKLHKFNNKTVLTKQQ